jgi:hypothetical protein
MKRTLIFAAIVAGIGAMSANLHSQSAVPAAAPAAEVSLPTFVIPAGNVLEQLKAIRDSNARLLDAQAATLLKLEEMEKNAQALKVLGKRS